MVTLFNKFFVLMNMALSAGLLAYAIHIYASGSDDKAELARATKAVGDAKAELERVTAETAKHDAAIVTATRRVNDDAKRFRTEADKREQDITNLRTSIKQATDERTKIAVDMELSIQTQKNRRQEVERLRVVEDGLLKENKDLTAKRADKNNRLAQAQNRLASTLDLNRDLVQRLTRLGIDPGAGPAAKSAPKATKNDG